MQIIRLIHKSGTVSYFADLTEAKEVTRLEREISPGCYTAEIWDVDPKLILTIYPAAVAGNYRTGKLVKTFKI